MSRCKNIHVVLHLSQVFALSQTTAVCSAECALEGLLSIPTYDINSEHTLHADSEDTHAGVPPCARPHVSGHTLVDSAHSYRTLHDIQLFFEPSSRSNRPQLFRPARASPRNPCSPHESSLPHFNRTWFQTRELGIRSSALAASGSPGESLKVSSRAPDSASNPASERRARLNFPQRTAAFARNTWNCVRIVG